jgi:hypothetical protein
MMINYFNKIDYLEIFYININNKYFLIIINF